MFLRQAYNLRKSFLIAIVVIVSLSLSAQDCIADSVGIKGVTKIQRMGGYVIAINYETRDEWTDGLLFKVHCKFNEENLTFTSGSLNNIERGYHKTEIIIPEVIRKRYGSLREYKIDLYRNGILMSTKKSY